MRTKSSVCLSILQKQGNRCYKVGNDIVEIPKKIVEKMCKWAEFPCNISRFVDRRFVQALLMICVGSEMLIKNVVSEAVKQFIHGKQVFLNKK